MTLAPLVGPPNGEKNIITQEYRTHPSNIPPPTAAIPQCQGDETTNDFRPSAAFKYEDFSRPPNRIHARWVEFKERLGARGVFPERLAEITENTAASGIASRRYATRNDNNGDPIEAEEVDEIFVDSSFRLDANSDHAAPPPKGSTQSHETHGTIASGEFVQEPTHAGVVYMIKALYFRAQMALARFFFTSFFDPVAERQYKKEKHWLDKASNLWGCVFILLHWILACIPIDKENTITADKMFYYVVCPCLAIPLAPLVAFDWTVRFPIFYQLFLTSSIWSWAAYNLILLQVCGYYSPTEAMIQCPLKVAYRATQKAHIQVKRVASWKQRTSGYLFREIRTPLSSAIGALNNMLASGLLETDHFEIAALEGSLTKMNLTVNNALTINNVASGQFESVSKPYAFHEVIRNMLVSLQLTANARGLDLVIELDEQIDRVSRLMIDKAFAKAAASYTNQSPEKKFAVGTETTTVGSFPVVGSEVMKDGIAVVVGDENLLRHVFTSLASNACKFTPTGGKIWIRTKLVPPDKYDPLHPALSETPGSSVIPGGVTAHPRTGLDTALFSPSAQHASTHNASPGETPASERIVIRIEVEDTGVGIGQEDMYNGRLFSPYARTGIRGQVTGLGLPLTKQLVRLSGGRMGVKSKRNHGSMFWVELGVEVGRKVLEMQDLIDKNG
ncbi:hypothetical protein FRC01_001759 [Tulasnella sp. 417]|nr:hypothetical protein FRC01_001759 [Tulasnella sp. 417]